MTRPMRSDYMQGFRYHVVARPVSGSDDPLQPNSTDNVGQHGAGAGAQAGFQSVTIPEISVEASEYREGIFKWTEKYPGVPTVSDISLIRGVVKEDTTFYDMVMKSIEGIEYRCEVEIYQYHRLEVANGLASTGSKGSRVIICENCFATRAKPNGDLDSTAGDVSLSEIDLCMESFKLSAASDPGTAV
jgi:hypothetical protein